MWGVLGHGVVSRWEAGRAIQTHVPLVAWRDRPFAAVWIVAKACTAVGRLLEIDFQDLRLPIPASKLGLMARVDVDEHREV